MIISKMAVTMLAATVLTSFAVAHRRESAMTCRGVLTATRGSEDAYKLGHCRIYVDAHAGVVEAIGRACKVGDRCTVRARMQGGAIASVYSAARH